MRFLRRRKEKGDESEEDSKDSAFSRLGIFSPSISHTEPDPAKECRKLAELERIFVRSKKLESLEDVPYVVHQVKEGNIVLLDITRLNDGKMQNHMELKRIIERIRGETRSYSADIALVNDSCVIVAPSFVHL